MKKNKTNLFLKFYFILVIFFTMLIFTLFNKIISPKLSHIAELEFTKSINEIASKYSNNVNSENLFKVSLNDKKEIIAIDYQMQEISKISHYINQDLLQTIKNKYPSNDDEKLLLMLPIGVVSNAVFLNNLGPKIPVIFHFINSVFSNVKTKVTNYGINNALLEINLEVSIKYELITPANREANNLLFNILLGAKVINGTVPNWYGNEFTTQSSSIKEEFFKI